MLCLLTQVSVANQLQEVPEDYLLSDIPLGSVVKLNKEVVIEKLTDGTILSDLSKFANVFGENSPPFGRGIRNVFCALKHERFPRKKILPLGTELVISNITQHQGEEASSCMNLYSEMKFESSTALRVRSSNGINGYLICSDTRTWIAEFWPRPPCTEYSFPNKVKDLEGLTFLADPKKI